MHLRGAGARAHLSREVIRWVAACAASALTTAPPSASQGGRGSSGVHEDTMRGHGAVGGASPVAPPVRFIDARGAGAHVVPEESRGLPTAR